MVSYKVNFIVEKNKANWADITTTGHAPIIQRVGEKNLYKRGSHCGFENNSLC